MLLDWGLPSMFTTPIFFYTKPHLNNLVTNIKLLAVLASEAGLKKITQEFPELEVCDSVSLTEQVQPTPLLRSGPPQLTRLSPQKA